jgi:hypothetical protein
VTSSGNRRIEKAPSNSPKLPNVPRASPARRLAGTVQRPARGPHDSPEGIQYPR